MGFIDKARDRTQVARGHGKEFIGKARKDKALQAEGKADQAAGHLKQSGGKVKGALKT